MTSPDWAENAQKFIDDIRECDDPADRFDLIMELGETLPGLEAAYQTEAYRVQGCTANVWLVPQFEAGPPPRVSYAADSDSMLVRGLAALLTWHVNGKTCQEVVDFDFRQLADQFALHQYLSPSRSNGVFAMSKRLGRIAASYLDVTG